MQNCLGIYIENNLIKYAKLSKDKDNYKVEAFGIQFFEDLTGTIDKIIEDTFSFNTPISINLANEKYLYYDIFALLSKKDIQKTIQTEFEAYCDENKYNQKAFETRYALTPSVENKEKIKAIQVIVNKIELNKQMKYAGDGLLSKVMPIGTAIASIINFDKRENAIIVNMEEKTTITTVYDRQVYDVEILDTGSQEVLDKINRVENSMSKSYDICKSTTIYTSDVVEETEEQPYLEYIIPTLYEISQKVKNIAENSKEKIAKIYLTGTLSNINNVDLYFQEFFKEIECKILRPSIVEDKITQINIKDYIEVNSAIALAMQALGTGIEALNFKKSTAREKMKERMSSVGSQNNKKRKVKKKFNWSFAGPLEKSEVTLIRIIVAMILINIIFIIFSKTLYNRMENKLTEVRDLTSSEQAEISKMTNDTNSLNRKNTKYQSLTNELKAINDKISNIAERKNSIPNLLNQIMYIIPETVQLTTIQNTTDRKIMIIAQADDYDQLGYFVAKIKLEGILKDAISSSGQKNGSLVTITIEGDLP